MFLYQYGQLTTPSQKQDRISDVCLKLDPHIPIFVCTKANLKEHGLFTIRSVGTVVKHIPQ